MHRERDRHLDDGVLRQLPDSGGAVAGMLFVLTAGVGLRERLITAIPDSLKHAIAVGIGLLVAMVGLQWAGVIVDSPGTLVTLGDLRTAPVMVALVGFSVMAVLTAWNLRAALLVGLLVSSVNVGDPPALPGRHPEFTVRPRNFVGQHFWARGYFVSTVGRDERAIRAYIPEQERDDRRQDHRRFDEQ